MSPITPGMILAQIAFVNDNPPPVAEYRNPKVYASEKHMQVLIECYREMLKGRAPMTNEELVETFGGKLGTYRKQLLDLFRRGHVTRERRPRDMGGFCSVWAWKE